MMQDPMKHWARDTLIEALEQYRQEQSPDSAPSESSFLTDDDFLDRFEQGELTEDEHNEFWQELATNARSREIFASMVEDDVLQLPHHEESALKDALNSALNSNRESLLSNDGVTSNSNSSPDEPVVSPAKIGESNTNYRILAIVACALVLFVGVIGMLWTSDGGSGWKQSLVQAELDLQEGRSEKAFQTAEGLLDGRKKLEADDLARVENLLENSAFHFAETRIKTNFQATQSIVARAKAKSVTSGRLENLRIQALRQERTPLSLKDRASISDYGFFLNGLAKGKSPGVAPEKEEERKARANDAADAFEEVLENYPQNIELMLNYGQLNLEEFNNSTEARKWFDKILDIDPDHADALLGRGIALYMERAYESALKDFQKVLTVDRENFFAILNSAMCLQQLALRTTDAALQKQRLQESYDYWKQAGKQATGELRKQILEHQASSPFAELIEN